MYPASLPRAKKFAVHSLSERAQIIIHQMLDRRYDPGRIARYISRTLREKISEENLAGYAKFYAATVQARENARAGAAYLTSQIVQHGGAVTDMLHAAFHEAYNYAKETGAFREMNPLLLEAAERKRREFDFKQKLDVRALELRERQVAAGERRVKVIEDRLKLDRKKAQAMIAKLEYKARHGKSLSAADMHRIRDIYGIPDDEQQSTASSGEEPPKRQTARRTP